MTIAEYRRMIENHSPGSLISRDWLVEQLANVCGGAAAVEAWVDTERAAEITGAKAEYLRRSAPKWRGVPTPEIRVSKNDPDNHLSRWLFAEEDCWAYARKQGASIRKDVSDDPDSTTDIADRHLERIVSNL